MSRKDIVNQISQAIRCVDPTATAILYGSEARGDKTWDQVAEWTLKSSSLSANVGIGATVAGHLQAKLNYNFALGKTGEVDAWNAVKQTYESVGSAKFSAWQVSVAWFF